MNNMGKVLDKAMPRLKAPPPVLRSPHLLRYDRQAHLRVLDEQRKKRTVKVSQSKLP